MQDRCFLVLSDGTALPGRSFGSQPYRVQDLPGRKPEDVAGEVVFNTAMTGYHETLTDPSYTGQIVVMTYPHAGNYGDLDDWSETPNDRRSGSPLVHPKGFIVRSLYRGPVPKGRMSLDLFLKKNNVPGIEGVDTRFLTLKIRKEGNPQGIVVAPSGDGQLSEPDLKAVVSFLASSPAMEGRDLIGEVGTDKTVVLNPGGGPHVACIDCGVKQNIVRELLKLNLKVTVFPATVAPEELLSPEIEGVLFSNGPGDPGVLTHLIVLAKEVMGKKPLFGICLGHQIIGLAAGAKTYKMKFGHHGVNHPVRDELTGRVFVTSQNHGFAVDESSLPSGFGVWFRNANDSSNEGLYHTKLPVRAVQFHPEASPGPFDASWIFREFTSLIQ